MANLTLKYEGKDVVFSREQIEAQGIRPGTELELRPKVELTPREFPPEERERRRAIIQRNTGIWSAETAAAYRKYRQDMWATWQPRTW